MPPPPLKWGKGEGLFFGQRRPYADVFGVNLKTKAITTFRKIEKQYNEVEGIFPDGKHVLVESSKDQSAQDSNHIDIWKMPLVPNATEYVRMTHWGEYDGYKASNPVVSPDGKTIAFQSARSKDAAGVGYGIYLLATDGAPQRRPGAR